MTQTVLITGCSEGGIGDALAQEFHRRGLKVFASARNLKKMNHLVEMGIQTLELDVTQSASILAAVEIVKKASGGSLDYLINNAGTGICATQSKHKLTW
jgi:1-acylglycerone phosphate reductase